MGACAPPQNEWERLEAYGDWPSFYAMLGEGYVAFTLDRGTDFEQTQGVVELKKEGLAASLQHYFDIPDQVNLRLLSAARQVEGAWVAGAARNAYPYWAGRRRWSSAAGREVGEQQGTQLGDEEAADTLWQEALAFLGTVSDAELTIPHSKAKLCSIACSTNRACKSRRPMP